MVPSSPTVTSGQHKKIMEDTKESHGPRLLAARLERWTSKEKMNSRTAQMIDTSYLINKLLKTTLGDPNFGSTIPGQRVIGLMTAHI
jgi:hypothetical protein